MLNFLGKKAKTIQQLQDKLEELYNTEDYLKIIRYLKEAKNTAENEDFIQGQLGRAYNNLAVFTEDDEEVLPSLNIAAAILDKTLKKENFSNPMTLFYKAFTTYSYAIRGVDETKNWLETKDLLWQALKLDPKHENTIKLIGWLLDEVTDLFLEDYQLVHNNTENEEVLEYLNDDQLANYLMNTLVNQVNNGGFIQLIQNGYSHQIFNSPFIATIKKWGLDELSELLLRVKEIFLKNEDDLTQEMDSHQFSELYKKYPEFSKHDNTFFAKAQEFILLWSVHILTNKEMFDIKSDGLERLWNVRNNAITRWKFTSHLTEEEQKVYDPIITKIDAWWIAFVEHKEQIIAHFMEKGDFDLPAFMNTHFNCIHKGIFWEYGPAINLDGHRLIINSMGKLNLIPLMQEIISRAPKIEEWEFYQGHFSIENDASTVIKTRTGVDIGMYKVQLKTNEQNSIDLSFLQLPNQPENEMLHIIYIALDYLIGEQMFSKWIGSIDLVDELKGNHTISFENIQKAFTLTVDQIKESLPNTPYFEVDGSWSIMKAEPKNQHDYTHQDDLFVIKTNNPALWNSQHSPLNFASERFSKFGEVFCYLKMDGSKDTSQEKFEDKSDIEDALDDILIKEKIGCFIGGGTGYRYSYIDLVLTDVEKGIQLIRETLQKGNISKSTWIMFYDEELAYEWVGIWEDSPKPKLIRL